MMKTQNCRIDFFVDITRECDFELRRLTVQRVSTLVSMDCPRKFGESTPLSPACATLNSKHSER